MRVMFLFSSANWFQITMAGSLIFDKKEYLIHLIEKCPLIYNKRDENYKDMTKKREAWREIASQLYLYTNEECTGSYKVYYL